MRHAGYGITANGLAVGIWPMNFADVKKARDRYRLKYPGQDVQAVPIEIGEPIKFPAPVDGAVERVLAHAATLRKLPDADPVPPADPGVA